VLTAPVEDRAAEAADRVRPKLETQLTARGLRWGAPMLIQIFKEDSHLDVWIDDGERYRLFRRYAICHWSGALGPKLRQGDLQAPEGFYGIRRDGLNPRSIAHLSMDLGYPNAYDRAHGRTGDFLMVHGHCISLGCYAMGDAAIEEIYTLAVAAMDAGQREIPVMAFPFRFDLRQEPGWTDSPWAEFWRELRAGHAAFARSGRPPTIRVVDGHYVVE
jgi:murein L,D-transpeptidase YafK